VASAAELRDINGQPLCPENTDLDTCQPGPDRLVCLPAPATETPVPVTVEESSPEASEEPAFTPVPTDMPTLTPTPTATPTRTPAPAGAICGDGVCQTNAENSDVCPQDCHCADNGVCEVGEGANCLDCSSRAGTCGAVCSDSAQCGGGLSCASGVCWDACACGGQCGGASGGGTGGGTPVGCDPLITDWSAFTTQCLAMGCGWNPVNCTCIVKARSRACISNHAPRGEPAEEPVVRYSLPPEAPMP
jgi:hypothetical protein